MEFVWQWVVRVVNLQPLLSVFLRLLLHQLPQSKIPGRETAEDQTSNHLLGNVLGSRILMERERMGLVKGDAGSQGEVRWNGCPSKVLQVG